MNSQSPNVYHLPNPPSRGAWGVLLIIIAVIYLSSCKSTSKVVDTQENSSSDSTYTQVKKELFQIGNQEFESLTLEVITEKPVVVFVDGEERLATETTTTRQVAIKESKTDSVFQSSDSTFAAKEDTTSLSTNFNKQTEGMEVVPDIVEGISKGFFDTVFGKVGKTITALILLVILIIVIRVLMKKEKSKNQLS